MELSELLQMMKDRKASDMFLTAGLPPMARVDGELTPLSFTEVTPSEARRLIFETLTDDQVEKLESTHELDFGYGVKTLVSVGPRIKVWAGIQFESSGDAVNTAKKSADFLKLLARQIIWGPPPYPRKNCKMNFP